MPVITTDRPLEIEHKAITKMTGNLQWQADLIVGIDFGMTCTGK